MMGAWLVSPSRTAKMLTEETGGDVEIAAVRESIASRFKSS
jgi:hypothetical protein